jgi:hypothetical protein
LARQEVVDDDRLPLALEEELDAVPARHYVKPSNALAASGNSAYSRVAGNPGTRG